MENEMRIHQIVDFLDPFNRRNRVSAVGVVV
jgi:hypothetical protein